VTSVEVVVGTAFADSLRGDSNANRLVGGDGNDVLAGRGGSDIFVFAAGMGQDTIEDFAGNGAAANDLIEISLGAAFDSFAEMLNAGTEIGGHVVFAFDGGNTLTLNNQTLASLHQNDFLFI
jgi:Ca2+-binding RTX toxin-like protein